jgi:nucleotide-binding universal stress UspA family protein
MMYEHILVAIEHSRADAAILGHIEGLARMTGARLLLVHVADGFAARHFEDLNLRESDEIRQDRVYLKECCENLRAAGLSCEMKLAMGDPATELIRIADEERVDLIAMSTHGHRFFKDVIHGTTVDRVRHTVKVPVLLLRGQT